MELTMKILSKYLDDNIYVEIYKGSTATTDLIEEGEVGDLKSQGLFETTDWADLPIEEHGNGIRADDEMLVILLDPVDS